MLIEVYQQHTQERAEQGLPPLPLDAQQTAELVELIKQPPAGKQDYLLDLLTHHVPPGVDEASYVKASFLADVAQEKLQVASISPEKATFLLGTCWGAIMFSR